MYLYSKLYKKYLKYKENANTNTSTHTDTDKHILHQARYGAAGGGTVAGGARPSEAHGGPMCGPRCV